ncbi:MAG: SpaA isopeptide-forming pilin-related protein [Lachnospiraceae bacterium]|nr:SpaA isopeptide-forming pilin-related protein [Lachnospiraceae bacterium]
MGNKRVKAYIAFLLLIALVTQNSYSSIADIGNVKSVYASEVDENGTAEDEIVSDDTIIPSEDVLTPGDDTQTPGDDTQTPSENVGTPSENTGTPSDNTGTPSENTGTPSGNTGTPSENAGTPSENTISPSMDKVVEDELEIIDGMIVGKGYDTITISVNSLKLGEKKFYNLFIDTKAVGITANNENIVGNKIGKYNNSVESVVIKGLNSESFKIYAKGITTDVSASFDVTSVETGTVNMTVMSDAEAVRRVYEYHDEDVKVTATLEEASAIPDDAELNVTAIKEGKEYDDYVKMIEEKSKEDPSLLLSNYLLYDISFILDGQEIEPEQGTVSVSMEFLKKQLKEENSTSVNEVVVLHVNDENECEVLEDTEADTTKNVVNQVEFVTDSFSTYVIGSKYKISKEVFDSNNYNLNYILNHFNLFISGKVKTSHTVGEVAVGGDGDFTECNGGIGRRGYQHTEPSYIRGIFKSNEGNAIETDNLNTMSFFLGEINKKNKISFKSHSNLDVKITDDYINFEDAFDKIEDEVDYLSNNLHFEPSNSKYEIGKNYRLKLNNTNLKIDISKAKEGTDTFILDDSNGTISFKFAPVKNFQSLESGKKTSIVFLFPKADRIVIPTDATPFLGHIIAPNAEIIMDRGNYNGCMIGTKLTGKAEGHMWPYNGKILKPTEAVLKAYKNVDGTPAKDQKFQFELYKKIGLSWVRKDTVDNKGAEVTFNIKKYFNNFENVYTFKIVESYNASLGYKKNTTDYYAKVTLLPNGNVNTIQYYNDEECKDLINSSEVVFDNLKETPKGKLKVQKLGGSSWDKFYFTIKDSNNNYILNSNGKIGWLIHGNGETVKVTDLPLGTYTINEVKDEDGTSLDWKFPYIVSYSDKDGGVTIDSTGTKDFKIINIPKPSADLVIKKYDNSNQPLDGAKFTLEYKDKHDVWKTFSYGDTAFKDIETKNGTLTIPYLGMETRDFRIMESQAPIGYKKLNEPLVTFKFSFDILKWDNVFSDIKYGNPSKSVSFSLGTHPGCSPCGSKTYTGGIVNVYNEKVLGSIELTKTDESGTKALPGAQFELYKDGNLFNTTNTTEGIVISGSIVIGSQSTYQVDENTGKLKISNLPVGTYYLKEVKAPDGYELPAENDAKSKEFTISQDNVSNDFEETIINKQLLGSFNITKVDEKGQKLPGAKFKLIDSNQNSILLKGENGEYQYDPTDKDKKEILETSDSSTLTVTGLPFGTYELIEVEAPHGYKKTVSTNIVIESRKIVSQNIINAKITANVEFYKADAVSKKTISGATFELYKVQDNKDGERIDTLTAGEDGRVYKQNLDEGNYYFKEKTAPLGYQRDTKKIWLTISKKNDGTIIKLGDAENKIYNERATGRVKIEKTDASNNLIDGAKFNLYSDHPRNAIESIIQDRLLRKQWFYYDSITVSGSQIISDLPWGDYYLVETEAPIGKVKSTQHYPFTISANHLEDTTYTGPKAIKNESIKGSVKLIKTDSVTKSLMSDVEFNLFKINDNSLGVPVDGKFITKNGELQVNDLEYGNYYFTEKDMVKGYQANITKYKFSILKPTADKIEIVKVENVPVSGNVTISKNDSKDHPLAGAEFTLYSKKPTKLQMILACFNNDNNLQGYTIVNSDDTGDDGIVTFENLTWGDYAIKETRAPKGYDLDPDAIRYFTVNAEKQSFTYKYVDQELTGSIKLKKVDVETQKTLSGANFQLYKDGEPYDDKILTTDENGLISVHDLPWGTYHFVETKAPNGYILNTEHKTEEITIGKDTVSGTQTFQTVSNQPTQISFSKKSLTNESEVAGAVLEIREKDSKDSDPIDHWTSTDKPHLITAKLNPNTTYVMSEIEAPKGYGYADPIEFTVSENGTVGKNSHTVTMKDRPYNLRVRKTDLSGNELAGAVFALMNSANVEIDSWKSDNKEDHVVDVAKLTPGETYQLIEKSAPEGYQTAEKITISISRNGTITTNPKDAFNDGIVMVRDEVISGNVILKKTDATDNKPLKGVSFELYKGIAPSGTLIKKYETDDKGIISVNGLLYGDYYFKEITPQGYQEYKGVLSFKISEQGKEITLDVKNERMLGSVTLTKIDGVSKNGVYQTLSGAEFKLYTKEPQSTPQSMLSFFLKNVYYEYQDNENIVYTTGEDGKLTVTGLPWGSYYFVETKAPKGYETPMSTTYPFIIDATKEQQMTIDIGEIKNFKETTKPPVKKSSSSDEETTTTTSTGNSVTGVLGIASAPIYGVLGARMSPLTGDNLNAFFWLMLLSLSGGTVGTVIFVKKRKKRKVE